MELEQALAKITELEGKIEGLSTQLGDEQKKYSDLETKLAEDKKVAQLSEQFNKMLTDKKAIEAQREAFMGGDMVKFAELAMPLHTEAVGTEGEGEKEEVTDSATPAQDKIIALAEKLAADKKISFGQAQGIVLSENPELQKAYELETTIN
jgi:hypothetical protein